MLVPDLVQEGKRLKGPLRDTRGPNRTPSKGEPPGSSTLDTVDTQIAKEPAFLFQITPSTILNL